MTSAEALEERIREARVYQARGTQNHHDEAIVALAGIRLALWQRAEKREADLDEARRLLERLLLHADRDTTADDDARAFLERTK